MWHVCVLLLRGTSWLTGPFPCSYRPLVAGLRLAGLRAQSRYTRGAKKGPSRQFRPCRQLASSSAAWPEQQPGGGRGGSRQVRLATGAPPSPKPCSPQPAPHLHRADLLAQHVGQKEGEHAPVFDAVGHLLAGIQHQGPGRGSAQWAGCGRSVPMPGARSALKLAVGRARGAKPPQSPRALTARYRQATAAGRTASTVAPRPMLRGGTRMLQARVEGCG